jgi:long-chain acyl-CoA synthetase
MTVIPTVAGVLRPALREHPDAPAIAARSGTLTYAELDRAADTAAGALWELGVRPGDRVAACLPNDLDIVIAFHGAQRIGAIWVGIAEAYTRTEQEELAGLSEPRVVLAGPNCQLACPDIVDLERLTQLRSFELPAPRLNIDPAAPAAIAYTSGTTGAPKGIVHSQRNLTLPGAVLVATRGWGSGLRKGDTMPMTILNLLVLSTVLVAQAHGCSVVMDRRDLGGIAELIAEHKVNVWNGSPPQMYDLARRPDLDLSSLTEMWSGGADTPDDLRRAVHELHGLTIQATYGLTEAPTMVAIDPPGGEHRTRCSGKALPHMDVAAYDDDGSRLPAGDVGVLRISAAAQGEWANLWHPPLGTWRYGRVVPHSPTDQVVTGDIGAIDGDGWITIVDRKKLVVIRGGANVYPAEVERVIRSCPAVDAAAVFGVPDQRLGQKVAALVVTREPISADSLVRLCREHLALYKVPELWGSVEQLPSNPMGKINRTHLAAILKVSTPL